MWPSSNRPAGRRRAASCYHLRVTLREAYLTLGLPPEATAAQVKTAYRRLAAETHPDRGGDATTFIRVRAAYEILAALLDERGGDDEIPVPEGLRQVIESIVADFREQRRWAEAQAAVRLDSFEKHMSGYIAKASRTELRQFSQTFASMWSSAIDSLFTSCNSRCDGVVGRYDTWYTESTQALFDKLHRRELLLFVVRRRFWEVFLVLGALAGGLSVVIGWEGPWRPWVSAAAIAVAAGVSFAAYWWRARRQRRNREKVQPLNVVVFELDKNARFATESALRKGRRTTAALGLAGMFLGNAASGGLLVPVVGAVAGTALGGTISRLLNPIEKVRAGTQTDLRRFMAMARPQVTAYVLEAHDQLLSELRSQIVENYQQRVKDVVKLLTAGSGAG